MVAAIGYTTGSLLIERGEGKGYNTCKGNSLAIMKVIKTFGMSLLAVIAVSFCILGIIPALNAEVYGVTCIYCGDVSAPHNCPRMGSGSPGRTGGGWVSPAPSGPSAYELEMQRKRKKANEFNKLGIKYWKKGDWQKAAEHFQKALEYNPGNKTFQKNLGKAQTLVKQEKSRLAREERMRRELARAKTKVNQMLDDLSTDFDGSKTGTPSTAMADSPSNTADSLEFIGSKDSLDSLPVVDPRVVKGEMTSEEARAAVALADLAKSKGNIKSAVYFLYEACEAQPDDRDIQLALGEALYLKDKLEGKTVLNPKVDLLLDALQHGKGDWKKSIQYLEKYRKLAPEDLAARDALNFTAGISGYYQAAQKAKNPLEKNPPRDKTLKGFISKAVETSKKGDYEKAFQFLKKAHELSPEDMAVRDGMNFAEGVMASQNTQVIRKKHKEKNPFDPSPEDSAALLPAVKAAGRMVWPGETREPERSNP